ncbi:MAG: hypothetical protein JXO51_05305 [Candidatus Aminicenantes bacterium]|nr:hypothetical protein [Candidatus Aminicenantes bacterium]
MSGRNRRQLIAVVLSALLLAAACGPAEKGAREAARERSPKAVDTSTAADWQVNCAQFRTYRGELIFTAAETTTADGQRVVAWAANDRAAFLAVFRGLALDGVPELKRRRDRILAEAEHAPGGGRLVILPGLSGMIDSLWRDIEAEAQRHGISCREPKA